VAARGSEVGPTGVAGGSPPSRSGNSLPPVEREVTAGDDGLVEVRLLRLPLAAWQDTQEHVDGLLREFTLVVQDEKARAATPGRLLALIRDLRAGYGQFSEAQRREMASALERGEREIDLTYRVPPGLAGPVGELGAALDEADEYCARGDHLLTLASPAEVRRFRAWFIAEFVRQLGGGQPTPWPDYDRDA
jgi:hypothetical protein